MDSANYLGSYEIISSGLWRLLKTKFFEKKGNLSSQKCFQRNFLLLSSITDVQKHSVRDQNVY